MIATPGSNAFKTDLNQAPWLAHYPQEVPAQLDYPSFPAWGFLAQPPKNSPGELPVITTAKKSLMQN